MRIIIWKADYVIMQKLSPNRFEYFWKYIKLGFKWDSIQSIYFNIIQMFDPIPKYVCNSCSQRIENPKSKTFIVFFFHYGCPHLGELSRHYSSTSGRLCVFLLSQLTISWMDFLDWECRHTYHIVERWSTLFFYQRRIIDVFTHPW